MTEALLDNVQIRFDTQTLWILNLALSLVMFGISLDISVHDFTRLFRSPRPIVTGILSQFVALPALSLFLVWSLDPMPSIALGMIMVAACPGGNISNFISHLAGGNTALSISLTSSATVLAIVLTPFNLQFWGSLYAPTEAILRDVAIDPWEMMRLVTLLLALPLLLGMGFHHRFPNVAKKMAKVFKVGSLVFFIALVVLAFYKDFSVFMEYLPLVFWIVVFHNLSALLVGYLLGWMTRLKKKDRRTIAIETGIQNSGLGLLLVFTFFHGMGGMALTAAFWGLWHLVSGLLLGGFWGYRPIEKGEWA